jgi:hypothetical protein
MMVRLVRVAATLVLLCTGAHAVNHAKKQAMIKAFARATAECGLVDTTGNGVPQRLPCTDATLCCSVGGLGDPNTPLPTAPSCRAPSTTLLPPTCAHTAA